MIRRKGMFTRKEYIFEKEIGDRKQEKRQGQRRRMRVAGSQNGKIEIKKDTVRDQE